MKDARDPKNRSATRTARRAAILVVASFVSAAVLPACGESAAAPAAIAESATYKVDRRDLRVTVTEKGTLKTANQVLVRPKIPGQAKIVSLVDEGTAVQAGDVLCELDKTSVLKEVQDLESRVISLQGELTAAESELEIQISENLTSIRDAELAHHFAEIELERWEKGEHVQELTKREIRVTEATSELERQKRRYEEMPDLAKEGFVTKEQVEEERIKMVKAESELTLSRLDLENYKKYEEPKSREQKESDVRKAGEEVQRAKQRATAREAQRKSDVERQKSELGNVRVRLSEAKTELEAMVIRAPAAGMVVYGDARNPWEDRQVKVGETVYSGQPFLTLPDLSEMVVVVAVHEADISRVKPGQAATINVETVREKAITGKVVRVAPMAAQQNNRWSDGIKRFNVDVALEGDVTALKLKPGLTATCEILVEEMKGVVSVPVQSVFSQRGKFHVFQAGPEGAKRTPVEISRGNQQYVVITGGLAEGDRVLLYDPESGGTEAVAADSSDKSGGDKAGGRPKGEGKPAAAPGAGAPGGAPGGGAPRKAPEKP